MTDQDSINYNRIAEAISYIRENFKDQPDLDEVAGKVFMSPFHFQRTFSDWVGTSPKKFLQYTTLDYAKRILKENVSLAEVAFESGLSGTGRLHDLFIGIEAMTPGEYKNGGKDLVINFSFEESPFGKILIASTPKGICHLVFADEEEDSLIELQARFPNAFFQQVKDKLQQDAMRIFSPDWFNMLPGSEQKLKLHLKGSKFQLKVWEALLKIPVARLTTYGQIAELIGNPRSSRAVGTAIGQNPVAFLIPCHRVIRSSGEFGGYRWNSNRKTAMIGWEGIKINAGQI